jgi:hypothetical protein
LPHSHSPRNEQGGGAGVRQAQAWQRLLPSAAASSTA